MSDVVSFAELDGQHVELLAARTVLSLLPGGGGKDGSASSGDNSGNVINDMASLLLGNGTATNG